MSASPSHTDDTDSYKTEINVQIQIVIAGLYWLQRPSFKIILFVSTLLIVIVKSQ